MKDLIKIFWKKIVAGIIMTALCYGEYIVLNNILNPIILLIIQVGTGFIIYVLIPL